MPEAHVPKLEDDDKPHPPADRGTRPARGKSLLKIALEVALISVGVFLGLAGEQWREDRRHHELAESTLRRFRSEIEENRKAVSDVRDYHATLLKQLQAYLSKDRKSRNTADVRIEGLRFVTFDQTAWDLAMTTQALTYVDPDLAFALSHAYNAQKVFNEFTRGMTQAMYLIPIKDNFDAFAQAAEVYYGDAVFMEPKLLAEYDDLIRQIDRALGD
ncbi:MAG TPA: hypothetical protein VFT39_21690 [Vicinamibacterales bacterium]|nr:hypothetical protein [Vicinamibacterales bacterium]